MEGREVASEEGTSSPYVPPQNQEVTSYLHLQNSRRKASLTSRRGGVSKSATNGKSDFTGNAVITSTNLQHYSYSELAHCNAQTPLGSFE